MNKDRSNEPGVAQPVTLQQIASELGVSTATVSVRQQQPALLGRRRRPCRQGRARSAIHRNDRDTMATCRRCPAAATSGCRLRSRSTAWTPLPFQKPETGRHRRPGHLPEHGGHPHGHGQVLHGQCRARKAHAQFRGKPGSGDRVEHRGGTAAVLHGGAAAPAPAGPAGRPRSSLTPPWPASLLPAPPSANPGPCARRRLLAPAGAAPHRRPATARTPAPCPRH